MPTRALRVPERIRRARAEAEEVAAGGPVPDANAVASAVAGGHRRACGIAGLASCIGAFLLLHGGRDRHDPARAASESTLVGTWVGTFGQMLRS